MVAQLHINPHFFSSHNLPMCPQTVSAFHITSRTTAGPTITVTITTTLATIQERVTTGFITPLATTRAIEEAVVAWLRMTSLWSASRSVCVAKSRAQQTFKSLKRNKSSNEWCHHDTLWHHPPPFPSVCCPQHLCDVLCLYPVMLSTGLTRVDGACVYIWRDLN